jgi:hypothetical protein
MRAWQPVESAPKDGSLVLCMTRHGDYEISRWDAVVSCWVSQRGFFVEPVLWAPLPPRPPELAARMESGLEAPPR